MNDRLKNNSLPQRPVVSQGHASESKQGAPHSLFNGKMHSRLHHFLNKRSCWLPLFWTGNILGFLWALPLTLAGLLLALPALVWRGRAQLVHLPTFALLVRGPFADYILERHPFGAMSAMALGHVIIAESQGLSPRILAHELAHVRQAAHWGITFPIVYLASSAWAAIRGRDAYWHNHFEIAARKAERHF